MKKLKHLVRVLLSFIPTRLPVGMTEFDSWSDDVIELAGAPNNDSVKFALATMILHLPEYAAYRSKHSTALKLKKSMANQVAAAVIQDLKAKQQAAMEAEKKKAEEEAAAKAASEDGQQK